MTPSTRRALERLALVRNAERNRRLRALLTIDPAVQSAKLRETAIKARPRGESA